MRAATVLCVALAVLPLAFCFRPYPNLPVPTPSAYLNDAPAPHVHVIYTGGTIGMKKDENGEYVPCPGYLEEMTEELMFFHEPGMPTFDITEYDPLLDSSNMTPDNWLMIAQDIESNYDDYDGFVVVHGTDTMAYTASALSFLLENLNKTVVVTGSQIPLSEMYNDGVFNLVGSIYVAGWYQIPEVGLWFNSKMYRGNRAQKYSAWSLEAFDTATIDPLVSWGETVMVWDHNILPYTNNALTVPTSISHDVTFMHMYPGITGAHVEAIIGEGTGIKAVVVLAYGTGNGPSDNTSFLNALSSANDRGVVIAIATQTHQGNVDLGTYETGGAMARVGGVGAFSMTPECCLTKLAYLMANHTSEEAKTLFQTVLRGEYYANIDSTHAWRA
ncbi:L-asparaginase, type I [Kipferlia bialata]|uniref:asparaginase n=1 Tax=Kipferlia bialata TaxID=797122 RepID=A0A9K3D2H2_9EUKA|nr:L-asparaginase, type I [Kipferlia bialata]|eukprot:g8960.t1